MKEEKDLTRYEVSKLLKKTIVENFPTHKEFVEHLIEQGHKISEPSLSDMIHERKGISMVVLEYLGLRKIRRVETLFRRVK